MGRRAAYTDPETRARLLAALRSGLSRMASAQAIGVELTTLLGWIDRDPILSSEVIGAEAHARGSAVMPSRSESDPKRSKVDRWEKMRREASELGEGLFGVLLWVDAILVKKGFPPISPWWLFTIRCFYESGKEWLLVRVGRGGGKSTTLCRVAVVEAIFADRKIPPGVTGVWPFFSVDRSEASERLITIKSILDALGISYEESNELGRKRIITEDRNGNPIEFKVYPATVGAASGFTGVGATCDEESKWRDESTGSNPAKEVLRALRPTLGRIVGSTEHGYRCSSAFSEFGTHYEDVETGDDELHYVAKIGEAFFDDYVRSLYLLAEYELTRKDGCEANAELIREYAKGLTPDSPNVATWVANPTADPKKKRIKEKDLCSFLREYASRPVGTSSVTFYDHAMLRKAVEIGPSLKGFGKRFAAIDTGNKHNAFALAIVERIEKKVKEKGKPDRVMICFRPIFLKEWIPAPGAPLDLDRKILPEAAKIVRTHYCTQWITDTYYGPSVELRGGEEGIETVYVGPDPFVESYEPARRAINRGSVYLPLEIANCKTLVDQLESVRSQPTDAGKTKIIIPIEKQDGGIVLHGDLGVAFIRALAAAGAGEIDAYSDGAEDIQSVPSRYAD